MAPNSVVTLIDDGTWSGGGNVFDSANGLPDGDIDSTVQSANESILITNKSPFPGVGASHAAMQIPPKPKPHPKAGKFQTLEMGNDGTLSLGSY